MSFCRTAGTRTSRYVIGAICVAAGLALLGAASMASAIDSTLLSLRSTVAPGNDIAEIQVASAECLSKFRWKPKLRRACEDEAASPVVSLFWAPFSLIGDGGGGTPKG